MDPFVILCMKKTIERSYFGQGSIVKDAEVVNNMQHGIVTLSTTKEEKYVFATYKHNRQHGAYVNIKGIAGIKN